MSEGDAIKEVAETIEKIAEGAVHAGDAVKTATDVAETAKAAIDTAEGLQHVSEQAGQAATAARSSPGMTAGLSGAGLLLASQLQDPARALSVVTAVPEHFAKKNYRKMGRALKNLEDAEHLVGDFKAAHGERFKEAVEKIGGLKEQQEKLEAFNDGIGKASPNIIVRAGQALENVKGWARDKQIDRLQNLANDAEFKSKITEDNAPELYGELVEKSAKGVAQAKEAIEKGKAGVNRWAKPGNVVHFTQLNDFDAVQNAVEKVQDKPVVGAIVRHLGFGDVERTSTSRVADALKGVEVNFERLDGKDYKILGGQFDGKKISELAEDNLQALQEQVGEAQRKLSRAGSNIVRNARVSEGVRETYDEVFRNNSDGLSAINKQVAKAKDGVAEGVSQVADAVDEKNIAGRVADSVKGKVSNIGQGVYDAVGGLGDKREKKKLAEQSISEAAGTVTHVVQVGLGAVTTVKTARDHVNGMKELYAEANGVDPADVSMKDLRGEEAPEVVRGNSGVGIVTRVLPSLTATTLALTGETIADKIDDEKKGSAANKAAWGIRAVSRVSGFAAPYLQKLVPNPPVLQYREAMMQGAEQGFVHPELVMQYAQAFTGMQPTDGLQQAALADLSERYAHHIAEGGASVAQLTQALHNGDFAAQLNVVAEQVREQYETQQAGTEKLAADQRAAVAEAEAIVNGTYQAPEKEQVEEGPTKLPATHLAADQLAKSNQQAVGA